MLVLQYSEWKSESCTTLVVCMLSSKALSLSPLKEREGEREREREGEREGDGERGRERERGIYI